VNVVITLHGEIRWLVALVAIVALVKYAMGLIQKTAYTGMDRGLMAGLTGLADLNLLLGLIIIIFGGGFTGPRIEHAGTMLIAIIVLHASSAWRKSDDAAKKFRNNLIVIVVALAIVFVGVLRLRGGWIF
jgi:hypothetical protein